MPAFDLSDSAGFVIYSMPFADYSGLYFVAASASGFAFVWNDGDIIKFFMSTDLTWDDTIEELPYFIHITDTHVKKKDSTDWKLMVNYLKTTEAEFVICSGDLVDS